MPEFKVKNTDSGNEYYFQTDRINIGIKILRGGLVSYADRSREMQFEEAVFTVEIEGVWTVPSGRSHPTATPKSGEDIWAMALTEAANGRAVEVYPTITEGTEGGLRTATGQSQLPAGTTSIDVDDGGGSNYDVNEGQVIEFSGHSDRYIVQSGGSGSARSALEIADPGLTSTVNDNEDITLYEGVPLSVLPVPGSSPKQKQTEKGADRLTRSVTFESDQTYDSTAHIWDLLSDLTDAL